MEQSSWLVAGHDKFVWNLTSGSQAIFTKLQGKRLGKLLNLLFTVTG
jgi:hypothetical protein